MTHNYLLDLITQSIDDGVIYIDHKLNISIFNPAAVRYSGINANQAIGKSFSSVLSFVTDDQKPVIDLVKDTFSGHDSPLYHQTVMICQDSADIPIVYRLIPVNDESNKTYGCLFVFRDYQLDRYKTDFLSLVAHQLKTPLGSMRWNLESLLAIKDITDDATISDIVRDVYNSNSRLISLVDDLLNASRIDARKVVTAPEPTNIGDVVGSTLKELAYQIQQKQIKINLKLEHQSDIVVDPKHFREVIENLLSNAIKYNRQNGAVTISAIASDKEVKIAIGDTGIGIPDSELPQIFSKSFRAKNAVETQIDGSGLGLYVAKSFVEDWGGSISCQSAMGQGTTITFTVPFKAAKTTLDKNLSI